MSKYTPIPGYPQYEKHVDGRVRKASNRHWVTDPFVLEELGLGTQSEGFTYWLLGCCGRPWFADDWWGAREHQVLCLQVLVGASPCSSPGRCTTSKISSKHKPVGDSDNWGPTTEYIPAIGANVSREEHVSYPDDTTPIPREKPAALARRTDGPPRQRFMPVDGELIVSHPPGWKPGDPLTQTLSTSQMAAYTRASDQYQ